MYLLDVTVQKLVLFLTLVGWGHDAAVCRDIPLAEALWPACINGRHGGDEQGARKEGRTTC